MDHRFTPRMGQCLARAEREAEASTGTAVIGTEHLLLALLDDDDAIATQVLNEIGVADPVRDRLREILASEGYRQPRS